ncbi:type IV toxin-antitoxin system AbiEi family antitoxin [Chitinophaga japonensis]|uniref:Uncharacterized protein n=1 Tax=Chitinophaga japonensis TaxID=104662 RepID=A0A562TFU2_CHIJA|nr:type IV toxin-antitoxin system AbiEi family antitoxin [Chitinophaga japonensis]TWI92128.1 hypothetical protein LX66_1511 [Chitinophaga japonensis]
MNISEKNIVADILTRLQNIAGIEGIYRSGEPTRNREIDGEIDFLFRDSSFHVFVEIKKELKPYHLPKIQEYAKKYKPFMVVAEHIYPAQKKILKENGIGYLDGAGNIFLEQADGILWLEGNKPVKEHRPVTNRAFTKAGLTLVFHFLLYEETLNLPYRSLALAANVSLGNIKNIIEGLKEAGFILQVGKGKKVLQNKRALLHRWITAYQETLKPTLHLGNFNFWEQERSRHWESLIKESGLMVWGGEAAAKLLINHLEPEFLTLYIESDNRTPKGDWMLIPNKNGRLKLYKKFWTDTNWDFKKLTPPLLIYADLMITGDPRCIEAAMIIYDKFLKDEFDQR